jgi:hypothetical protein
MTTKNFTFISYKMARREYSENITFEKHFSKTIYEDQIEKKQHGMGEEKNSYIWAGFFYGPIHQSSGLMGQSISLIYF